MKLHGIKLLWIGGVILVASAMVFTRVSTSLNSGAAQTQLAALGSMYKSSDPSILTAPKSSAANSAMGIAEEVVPQEPGKMDFAPYLRLHLTRADNIAQHEGID